MKAKFLIALLGASFIPFASFSEDFTDEDVIVVSGSKVEQSVDSTVEKVNVISSDELEKKGARTVAESLRSLPGVVVTQSTLKNKSSSVMIQGFEGQYVKILIDGVAVDGENGGAVYLERLPIENIDHIEVVQGATSALYGSDAMGGVINIITKKNVSEDESLKISGNISEDFATSFQNKTGIGLNLTASNFFASANGSFDWRKGLTEEVSDSNIGSVDETKIPKSHLGYANARFGYNAKTWKVSVDGSFSDYLRETTNIGVSRRSKYISENDYSEQRFSGVLRGEKEFSDTLGIKAYLSGKNYTAKLDETKLFSTTADSDSESKNKSLESEIQVTWTSNDYNSLVCGLYGMYETEDGSSFTELEKQALVSLFAQDEFDFTGGDEKLVFNFGGRLDLQPAINGSKTLFQATPKAGLKYMPFDSTTLRLAYGMGYKLPTLKQKYYVFYHSHGNSGFYVYGNKDLDPEYSHGFNLNLDQKIGERILLTAGGFYNIHKSLIDSEKLSSGDYQYKNIEKAFTYGGSLGLSGKFDRVEFSANYTYTVAKQHLDDDYYDLTFRVPHRIAASFAYMIPVVETQICLDGEWNAPQLCAVNPDEKTPDLFLVNMTARKKFMDDNLEVYARAENLFNNKNFKDGSNEENQEEYFSLHDGLVFHFGFRFKF